MAPPERRVLPVAGIVVWFLAAAAAPSPLYVVYQQEWRLSTGSVALVFAVYAAAVLLALLSLGELSDHVGRRPVLAFALALETVALVLFLTASSSLWLGAARIVQGIATGTALPALSATLVDLEPTRARPLAGLLNGAAPLLGLALGALGSGALVTLAPAPRHLVYLVLLCGALPAAAVVAALRESAPRRPGSRASLRPRLAVPHSARTPLLGAAPVFVAAWMLDGLLLSLGPSLTADLLGLRSHLLGGLVIATFCGSGVVSEVLLRRRSDARSVRVGAGLLAGGMGLMLLGVEAADSAPAALGVVVAGFGFGAAQLGSFGTAARLAPATGRGELLSVLYLVSYLSFGGPALAAGFAAESLPLADVVLVFGIVVLALSLLVLAFKGAADEPISGRGGAPAAGGRVADGRRAPSRHGRQDPGYGMALLPLVSSSRRREDSGVSNEPRGTP